jgi:YegS/Rv2252/BmrU family lipid kinase
MERPAANWPGGKRVLLVANPQSRHGDSVMTEAESALRQAGFTVDGIALENPPELPAIVRSHASRADLIVLAGGDGTFSCAAEAVMEAGLPLGLIPTGTANDLARTLDLPADPAEACAVIAAGHSRRVDLGTLNGKPFFNAAHIGFAVAVARKHTDERKKRFGVAAYLLSVRDAVAAHEPFWCDIVCDGRRECRRLDQLTIGNGRHYGGGLTVSENASIDDGALDLYAIPPLPWWRALALLPRLRAGPRRRDRGVLLMRGAEVEVRTEPALPINVDGEVEGTTPARFGVLPGALTIFAPAASGYGTAEGEGNRAA